MCTGACRKRYARVDRSVRRAKGVAGSRPPADRGHCCALPRHLQGQQDRHDAPALLKLRLMENEENLFDGGLYIGIAGTATALVLQVLQVIEPNLLAAYSSNLFGICCVAIIKIRHVRPYKRTLILAGQNESKPVIAVA